MKLDKRKCRKFAIPDRKLSLGSGILRAKQINYIVTTAIKIINHHRTLILYIYPRKQASRGDYKPLWTMFHTKDNFLTLERREDGSTAWRTASFDRLDRNTYNSSNQCAFYSIQDEKRVLRYFKADTDGFQTLSAAQEAVLEHRRQKTSACKRKSHYSPYGGYTSLATGTKKLGKIRHALIFLL